MAAASLLPVRGPAAAALDMVALAAIFALFFLHGVRLSREALLGALGHWRLHAAILGSTYVMFPLLAIGLSLALPGLLPAALWTGILFVGLLPSTVQTSIAMTSIARGNVGGAVAAAAASQMLGVFLTPLLAGLVLSAHGVEISPAAIGRIFALLFVPFVLGHLLRPRLLDAVSRWPRLTGSVDKSAILLAVYGAFSAAAVDGLWSRLPPSLLATVAALCLLLLGLGIAGTWVIGRLGGFDHPDRAAIIFCGSVKSIITGVPMARILFPGPAAGLVILPIMLFHAFQLIVAAWIAARMGAQKPPSKTSE